MPRPEKVSAQIAWRPPEKKQIAPILLQVELTGGRNFQLCFTPQQWSLLLLYQKAKGTMGAFEAIVDGEVA